VTCGVWVGYDSRESLGEKETGARAALPIWMTIMKQAIAGKDNEHFLGEDGAEKRPLLEAKATPPAKSGTAASPAVPAKPKATPSPRAALPSQPVHVITATAPDGTKSYIPVKPFRSGPPPHPSGESVARATPPTPPAKPGIKLSTSAPKPIVVPHKQSSPANGKPTGQ
jgi:penicillin-binding protein 1A